MTAFTPLSAAAGGALIGVAAVLMMAMTGRVAGISGLVSRLLPPYSDGDWLMRLAFIAGLATAPWLAALANGSAPEVGGVQNPSLLAIAGLLVGFGAVLGGGCTSGHGVCGLARVSGRSAVGTLTFMVSAVATVFIARHVLGAGP
jgi:hypothetical protein